MGAVFAGFQPVGRQKKRTNARFFQLVSYLIHPSEFHTIENQIRRSGVPLDILSGNPSPLRQELPVVKMIPPEGSFLLWLDFRATGLSHEQIREKLLHEAKLGLNSGTDFGPEGEGFFRMNIGCPLATVKEGLERLKKIFK